MRERKEHHFGYPYNLSFSYSEHAYLLDYLINNLGDPYRPSNYGQDSREFEKSVVSYFSKLWLFEDCWGYITSSGTEGNLAALIYGKVSLDNPVVYYSKDTHYSIGKGCRAYSLESVPVDSQPHGEIDYGSLQSALYEHRNRDAIIICNISTTFRGAYDSAPKILSLCENAGIARGRVFLHGDGALGGMIMPFVERADELYQVKGSEFFDSISVSGHKMPGLPVPCGVILARKSCVEKFGREIEYLNSTDTTLNGSRNGLAAVLLFHSLTGVSVHEWRKTIQTCLELAGYLSRSLNERGVRATINKYSNTVCFKKPTEPFIKKWQLACLKDEAHAIIMPNHGREQIDIFASELAAEFPRK
ncbi:MAG: histidine decarboxylase [Oscillospiraceae bacterium]|nr:histidine decarboxylase [Oscillospiraceae bacterium]